MTTGSRDPKKGPKFAPALVLHELSDGHRIFRLSLLKSELVFVIGVSMSSDMSSMCYQGADEYGYTRHRAT